MSFSRFSQIQTSSSSSSPCYFLCIVPIPSSKRIYIYEATKKSQSIMPSGAKKRKAAKKKKEQQANHQQGNSNSNSPLGISIYLCLAFLLFGTSRRPISKICPSIIFLSLLLIFISVYFIYLGRWRVFWILPILLTV